jgi:hypothetical protein
MAIAVNVTSEHYLCGIGGLSAMRAAPALNRFANANHLLPRGEGRD